MEMKRREVELAVVHLGDCSFVLMECFSAASLLTALESQQLNPDGCEAQME